MQTCKLADESSALQNRNSIKLKTLQKLLSSCIRLHHMGRRRKKMKKTPACVVGLASYNIVSQAGMRAEEIRTTTNYF